MPPEASTRLIDVFRVNSDGDLVDGKTGSRLDSNQIVSKAATQSTLMRHDNATCLWLQETGIILECWCLVPAAGVGNRCLLFRP